MKKYIGLLMLFLASNASAEIIQLRCDYDWSDRYLNYREYIILELSPNEGEVIFSDSGYRRPFEVTHDEYSGSWYTKGGRFYIDRNDGSITIYAYPEEPDLRYKGKCYKYKGQLF